MRALARGASGVHHRGGVGVARCRRRPATARCCGHALDVGGPRRRGWTEFGASVEVVDGTVRPRPAQPALGAAVARVFAVDVSGSIPSA